MRDAVLIRYPSLAILVGGQWVSRVGNDVYAIALPWLVFNLYHSTTLLGVTGGVAEAAALASIFSGVLVDRWDRRRTMMVADGVRGLACLGFFVMAATLSGSLALLIGLILALRLAGTFFGGSLWAVIPALVSDEDLPRAMGTFTSATTSAGIAGQTLGGVIVGTVGAAGAFLADAVSFIASIISLAFVRTERRPAPRELKHLADVWRELKVGQDVIWKNRFLSRLVATGAVLGLFSYAIVTLDVAWVRVTLHGSALAYAAFWVCLGIGQIVGGVASQRAMDRFSVRSLNAVTICFAGLAVAAISRVPSLAPDLALMFGVGLALSIQAVSLNVTVQRAIPSEVLGRAGGALSALTASTVPIGMLLAGIGASRSSVALIFLVAGLGMAGVGALLPFVLPQTVALPPAATGAGA